MNKGSLKINKEKIQGLFNREKVQELFDKEKIVNFIGENGYKIKTFFLLFIVFLLLVLIGFYGYKSYDSYKIVNSKISKIAVVSDKNVLDKIKKNNLRTINSVTSTLQLLYGKKYTTDLVSKNILLNMLNVEEGERYGNIIKISLLDGIKNKDVDIKELVKNIGQDDEISLLLGEDKYLSVFKNNYQSIIKSNLVRGYISSFPKAKFSDKNITNVVSRLYIYEIPFIESDLEEEYKLYDKKLKKYQAPYNNFLKNILFPSVNIWQNKFSDKINSDLFGGEYLKNAKYVDINLINYWTNFFKYAYNGENYNGKTNEIQDISIGVFKQQKIKGVENIVSLPVNVKFGVKSDSSFYGLVSKLTSTSNVKNIMLISEFTYNLWENIKTVVNNRLATLEGTDVNAKNIGEKYMVSLLKSCEEGSLNCSKLFACGNNCNEKKLIAIIKDSGYTDSLTGAYLKISKDLIASKMYNKESDFNNYFKNDYYKISDIDKLIGARLTDCINGGFCDDILSVKTKGDVVAKSIENFAGCNQGSILKCTVNPRDENCNVCRYKFANKFDTNYFIVYTLINNIDNTKNYTFVDRIKDVYLNIPGLLKLGSFKFSKVNNPLYAYDANVNLDVYYKFLSSSELGEILDYIGSEKCSSVTDGKAWSISLAKKYISNKINNLYNIDLGADEVYNLKVLQDLIDNKSKEYKKLNNIEKLLSNLQIYRIFLERGYCENR